MARPKNKENIILEAAVRVFTEKGFSATTIQDIASAAGIAKGTIYEYFPDKDELFIGAFKYQKRQVDNMVNDRLNQYDNFLDKVNAMLDFPLQSEAILHAKWVETFLTALPVLKESTRAGLPSHQEMDQSGIQTWSGILRLGVQEGKIPEVDIEFSATCVHFLTILFYRFQGDYFQYNMEKQKLREFIFHGLGYKA